MKSTKEIALENDLFRSTMIQSRRHKVVLTSGVADDPNRETVITKVRQFKEFTRDNDPHKEHDFGKISLNGTDYFWKIDYYDRDYEFGVDPKEDVCSRLLTIMLASEY